MDNRINHISIVGAGFMGTQLALHFAFFTKEVLLIEPSKKNTETARKKHIDELDSRISSGKITSETKYEILSRISFIDSIDKVLQKTDLVVEAAPENLKLKQNIFSRLDQICSPHTILATNSSSIPVSHIEAFVNRQEKLLNTHFYPLIWKKPVVELMKGSKTSDDTISKIIQLARQTALTPLVVKKESTGFIFNRIWRAIKKEALYIANEDIASFEDIDRAWMLLLNYPIGPFGIMDMVGLDVVRDIEMVYYRKSQKKEDLPPSILTDKISRGELGRKTGKGFYSYPNPAFLDPLWLKGSIKQSKK